MKISVILGSIRPIRRGGRVAQWLMSELSKQKDITVELLDLLDYPLPFFDESNSPQGLEGNYTNKVAKKWSAKIAGADGFIMITPEYNHGTSGVLKNALDWLYPEWNKKPVAFVSYARGAGGGIRAVEQLRTVVIELQMAPIHNALHISQVIDTIDEKGNLLQGNYKERLANLMDELLWWAKALKTARETKTP